jgi:transcriptional regulator with XRE-family HTH domain
MYIESFPEKLKKAREDTGFTQKEVEKETKIYQTALSRYEKGLRQPDLETLAILADFYGVSVDWLLSTRGKNTI